MFEIIFGKHTLLFYILSTLLLTMGMLTVKVISYYRRAVQSTFSLKYWIKDNWRDVVLTIFLSLLWVHLIDYLRHSYLLFFIVGLILSVFLQQIRKWLPFVRTNRDSLGELRKEGIIRPDGTPLGNENTKP